VMTWRSKRGKGTRTSLLRTRQRVRLRDSSSTTRYLHPAAGTMTWRGAPAPVGDVGDVAPTSLNEGRGEVLVVAIVVTLHVKCHQ